MVIAPAIRLAPATRVVGIAAILVLAHVAIT